MSGRRFVQLRIAPVLERPDEVVAVAGLACTQNRPARLVAERLGVRRETIRKALLRLVKRGVVLRYDDGFRLAAEIDGPVIGQLPLELIPHLSHTNSHSTRIVIAALLQGRWHRSRTREDGPWIDTAESLAQELDGLLSPKVIQTHSKALAEAGIVETRRVRRGRAFLTVRKWMGDEYVEALHPAVGPKPEGVHSAGGPTCTEPGVPPALSGGSDMHSAGETPRENPREIPYQPKRARAREGGQGGAPTPKTEQVKAIGEFLSGKGCDQPNTRPLAAKFFNQGGNIDLLKQVWDQMQMEGQGMGRLVTLISKGEWQPYVERAYSRVVREEQTASGGSDDRRVRTQFDQLATKLDCDPAVEQLRVNTERSERAKRVQQVESNNEARARRLLREGHEIHEVVQLTGVRGTVVARIKREQAAEEEATVIIDGPASQAAAGSLGVGAVA